MRLLLTAFLSLLVLGVAHAGEGVALERAFPKLRFDRPIFLTGAGDGSGRLFVVEQAGVVRVFVPDDDVATSDVFLDIRSQVSREGNEEGLLGFAFHPDFEANREVYVHYSAAGDNARGVVSRWRANTQGTAIDPASEEILLEVDQPWRNHNGGTAAFGPDGMLYVSFGDGGAANDPHGNGQKLSTLLGSILRLDVDARRDGYAIPTDNPFVRAGDDVRPEIWAFGFRNVWRFSFDRLTGDLWAGDVGQNKWEEVDIVTRGGNYGWRQREGLVEFDVKTKLALQTRAIDPVAVYGRGEGISITGGNVYRGARFPEMQGAYFYGDYVTGNVWRMTPDADGNYANELVGRTGKSIASFGEDDAGELFVVAFDGGIHRLVPSDGASVGFDDWPTKLSSTGLFSAVSSQTVADHVMSYEVETPFWSDDARKTRHIALPDGTSLGYRETGAWDVPVGATVMKSFYKEHGRGERALETRLIKRTPSGWEGATYVWDGRGSDATLAVEGRQFELWSRTTGVTTWHAPSASECNACHDASNGYVLGFTTAQLNRMTSDGKHQIGAWVDDGFVTLPDDAVSLAKPLSRARDGESDLEARARAYLDVNCAFCHRPEGPGNAAFDMRRDVPLADTGLLGGIPMQATFGDDSARVVDPGRPSTSMVHHRMDTLGEGRMPNVGSNVIDEEGVELIREWIASMAEQ